MTFTSADAIGVVLAAPLLILSGAWTIADQSIFSGLISIKVVLYCLGEDRAGPALQRAGVATCGV